VLLWDHDVSLLNGRIIAPSKVFMNPFFSRPLSRRMMRLGLVAGILSTVSGASAHDLLVKPNAAAAASGAPIALQVLLTEVYFAPDVVPPVERTVLTVLSGGSSTPVALTKDADVKALAASLTSTGQPTIVTATLSRERPARAEPGKAPEPAMLSEASSKALLNLSAGATGFDASNGSRLEIIPLANPAEMKSGQELPIKLLFDGKPLKAQIFASYDGFSARDHSFAFATSSEADGTAFIKLTAPGLWMVKTSHTVPETSETPKRYSAGASLVFDVK